MNRWFSACTFLCFIISLSFIEEQTLWNLAEFWHDKTYWITKMLHLFLRFFLKSVKTAKNMSDKETQDFLNADIKSYFV